MLRWWMVKVGGSLLRQEALRDRIANWHRRQPQRRLLYLTGGGPFTDVVRALDRIHQLGEENCHWFAIDTMSLTARLFCTLIPKGCIVRSFAEAEEAWDNAESPVLDAAEFLRLDDQAPDPMPHSWQVTSDSIAARFAQVHAAEKLVLLKACTVPPGLSRFAWSTSGIVDPWFCRMAESLPWVTVETLDDRSA